MVHNTNHAGDIARDRLTGIVEKNPGIHVRRLSIITGQSWNTCLHHLRHLEQKGVLASRKVQGRLCWFDCRTGAQQSKEGVCLLRDPANRVLAEMILANPGRSQTELATDLHMATTVVHRRVTRMESAGLLMREPHSHSMQVFPTPNLEDVTVQVGGARFRPPAPWGFNT